MKIKAPAKINLSLDITGKRNDGYHLLWMLMQSVTCFDEIEVVRSANKGIRLTIDGSGELKNDGSNLCVRAAEAMKARFGIDRGYDIFLKKNIPLSAGLAGGSADAAAVIRLIDRLEGLGADDELLRKVGLSIGSDVPYCLHGGLMIAEGTGDILTGLPELPKRYILIAKIKGGLNTGEVYRKYDTLSNVVHPDNEKIEEAARSGSWERLMPLMGNVLYKASLTMEKRIGDMVADMRSAGADSSMMSGSGPSVFGIFRDSKSMEDARDRLEHIYPDAEFRLSETCGPLGKE